MDQLAFIGFHGDQIHGPLKEILKYLHPTDIVKLCQTSKQYKQICDSKQFWIDAIGDEFKREYVDYPGRDPRKAYIDLCYYRDFSDFPFTIGDIEITTIVLVMHEYKYDSPKLIVQFDRVVSDRDSITSHIETMLWKHRLPYDITNRRNVIKGSEYHVSPEFVKIWSERYPYYYRLINGNFKIMYKGHEILHNEYGIYMGYP